VVALRRVRHRPPASIGVPSSAGLARLLLLVVVLAALLLRPRLAHAQACCAGASGLTPGWLTHHERALVGAQVRASETHGTYPTSGTFYARNPGRDARIETSLFGSYRVLPRAQLSLFAPLVSTRRRAGAIVEGRVAPGDTTLIGRYDLIRAGESWIPGIALLAGSQIPTGIPSDRGGGRLSADVTGTGAWELNGGASVEQLSGHLVLHATVLAGYRFPREVFQTPQHLGLRALYLVAGGYVFDDDVAILGTVSHTSEGDATVAGDDAPGTGWRTTQLALLVIVPITDTLRLRTSAFTDVPPLGVNRPAMGGTSISFAKTWF
jgi:hypothetical protein